MSNARSHSKQDLNQTVSPFAPLLLRDALLTNLLRSDYGNITYWAGKELARQFPIETSADLPAFFNKAAFGDLTIKYQSDDQQQWLLDGPMVADRLATNRQADFSLEAGFLAQQLELQEEIVAEGTFQIAVRQQTVTITILTDMTHKIQSLSSSEQVALRDRFLDQGEKLAYQDLDQDENTQITEKAEPLSQNLIPEQDSHSFSASQSNKTSLTETAIVDATKATAGSQTDDSLSIDQSITNSLLAFNQERQGRPRQDSNSSLDQ